MSITATVQSSVISASASGNVVSVSVSSPPAISTSASGGVGPQGVAGTNGGPIEQLSNVEITSVHDGDLIRYSGAKWRNYPETQLLDGGNY